jgi:hypothetical protein
VIATWTGAVNVCAAIFTVTRAPCVAGAESCPPETPTIVTVWTLLWNPVGATVELCGVDGPYPPAAPEGAADANNAASAKAAAHQCLFNPFGNPTPNQPPNPAPEPDPASPNAFPAKTTSGLCPFILPLIRIRSGTLNPWPIVEFETGRAGGRRHRHERLRNSTGAACPGAARRTLAQKPMTTNGTIAWIVIVIGLIPITGKVLFSAWRLVRRAAG